MTSELIELPSSPWSDAPQQTLVDVPAVIQKMEDMIAGRRPASDFDVDEFEAAVFQSQADGDTLRKLASLSGWRVADSEHHLQKCHTCHKCGHCFLQIMSEAVIELLPPPNPVSVLDDWEVKIHALTEIQDERRRTSDLSDEVFGALLREAVSAQEERGDSSKLMEMVSALKITRKAAEGALSGKGREMSKPLYRPLFEAALRIN